MKNFFNPWICAFAAAVGHIYYQSGNAFIDYDFTQFVTLYLLVATALLVAGSGPYPKSGSGRAALTLCALSGFFLSLALLIKQSNGAVGAIAVGLASIVIAAVLYRPRVALLRTAALLGGAAVPLAAVLLWLGATHALGAFFMDVVVDAFHAKGGLGMFAWLGYYLPVLLPAALRFTWSLAQVLAVMLIGPVVLEGLAALWNWRRPDRARLGAALRRILGPRKSLPIRALFVSITALSLLCILILAISRGACTDCNLFKPTAIIVRDSAYVWSPNFYVIGSTAALVALIARRHQMTAQFFAIAALGVGLTFGNGLSAGLSEISTFLGMTMLLAFLIDVGLAYLFPVVVPVALALVFCVFLVESKFKAPYTWWQVTTPPVGSTACADTEGILRGLCIPSHDYASIVGIENKILANSSPGQPIFVYPHMPIFYLLTDRPPFDNAVVSWFDATSDQLADDVSRDLRKNPPPVIVMAEIPDEVLIAHEHLFRNGKSLHQRKILASIADLQSRGLLQRIDRIKDLNGLTIDVYRSVHR